MKKICLPLLVAIGLNPLNAQQTARININGYEPKLTISKHIYGHFSEHLGSCIYDGYWVSDTSTVPRKTGYASMWWKP